MTPAISIKNVLNDLLNGNELNEGQVRGLLEPLLAGQFDEAEAAAFLVALRMKGETAREVAAAVQILRSHMLAFDPGIPAVLDTCGTGGDGSGTFNVSTATAFVVAGCGIPVVKHGNRSVSSRSGSADVLAALGVKIDGNADFVRQSLAKTGMGFCFAPQFHPAMKNVGPLRRKLGIPTIFNLLGPLANPAGPAFQIVGVGKPALLDVIAGAFSVLGVQRAAVVCSLDGLDEISLGAPTAYRLVENGKTRAGEWQPDAFGLPACVLSELRVEGPEDSATMVEAVLRGANHPSAHVTVANAAVAIWLVDQEIDFLAAVARAQEAIATGRAFHVLEGLRTLSSSPKLT